MSRTLAREVAMKMAYAELMGGEDSPEAVLEKSGEAFDELTPEELAFSHELVDSVKEHVTELDEIISSHAIDWSFDRIAKVDLCILRIALSEILYPAGVPESAAINAAIELAKKFGGEKSFAFINGILGTVSRERATAAD